MIKYTTNKVLKTITIFSFIILALFPVLKENWISITIIFCSLLTAINYIINKQRPSLNFKILIFTSVFWMYLIRELLFLELNAKLITLHISFLVLPLLFYFKPSYINNKVKRISFLTFQFSVIFQSIYFLIVFLSHNDLDQIFYIDTYNIPYFRDYVFKNSFIVIHPTYFSAYLLISFTISFTELIKTNKRRIFYIIHLVNSCFTVLFIFILASKIIIIALFISIIFLTLSLAKKITQRKKIYLTIFIFLTGSISSFLFQDVIFERFKEVKSEINKPIKGDYYNSTNIRVAIFNCSTELAREAPFFGYGNKIQNKINECFSSKYESDFYIKNTYNTHNYYFNLILYGGWIFLFLFLGFIVYLITKIKYSYLALIILFQILFINLTENYFSRQYGIMTFNYFIMIFVFFKKEHTHHIK